VKPNEVRAFLAKTLPADVVDAWPCTGKQRVLSTRAADLKRHTAVPAIRSLLAINAMTKLGNSFGEELAAKVSPTSGRLHPTYNIAGTKTGRFSSSNPNIQQIPKHKAKGLRGCFIAAPGMKLLVADYSAMELRAAAAISDDAAMNADFASGVDLHRRQAAEMLGIAQTEVTPRQRDTAKPIGFGTIYGAAGRGLAASAWQNYGIVLSESEAETARRAFLTRYSGLDAWMGRSFVQSNRAGFIAIGRHGRVIEASWEHQQRPDGRYTWQFPEDHDDDIDEEDVRQRPPLPWRGVLKRTLCCNAPVQGACADAAMLALTWIDAALIEDGIQGAPVLFVHDEIVLEVPEPDAERAGAMLVDCMTRAFVSTFPHAPVTGLVELKIVDAWGSSETNASAAGSADLGTSARAERPDADALADQRGWAGGGCAGAGAGVALDDGKGGRRHLKDAALRPVPKRGGPDDWPTPPCLCSALTHEVLPTIPEGAVWEPAPGGGALVGAITAAGRRVASTTADFSSCPVPPGARILATNPPFNQHSVFIERSMALLDAGALDAVVLLFRHDHLQSESRTPPKVRIAALRRAAAVYICR
jgi:hypothetical protein